MGDVLTLIEKAEETFDKDEAEKAAARLLEGQFTLDDFLEQMQQLKKMGPLQNLVDMIPNLPQGVESTDIDDGHLVRLEAIIQSMTAEERVNPVIIDGSRRSRIAKGSGATTHEVSQLLKQFKEIKKMMKGPKKSNKKSKNKKKRSGKKKQGRITPQSSRQKGVLEVPEELEKLVEGADAQQFDLSKFGTLSENEARES